MLTGNNISNKGAIRIALSIQKCEILLQSLDLSQNKIGPKASTALGHALSCNSLLSTLHLGDNEMGPDGCIGLAQVRMIACVIAVVVCARTRVSRAPAAPHGKPRRTGTQ